MTRTIAPYGTWASPLDADGSAGAAIRLGLLQGLGASLYWSESRPEEQGRGVVMRVSIASDGSAGAAAALVPAPFSVRSRVHEYGGGAFLATRSGLYFVNDVDQEVYACAPARIGAPERLTDTPRMRYGDMTLDTARRRLIAVAERHSQADAHHPENLLVAIGLKGEERGTVGDLVRGHDFFAFPRLSPDGRRLAFLAWDLPDMPWEGAALLVAEIGVDGIPGAPVRIAGGGGRAGAVFQPGWAADGTLLFVSDESGWGGLHRWDGSETTTLYAPQGMELFRPLWSLGMRSWALAPETGRIGCAFLEAGRPRLLVLDAASGAVIDTPDPLFLSRSGPSPFSPLVPLSRSGLSLSSPLVPLSRSGPSPSSPLVPLSRSGPSPSSPLVVSIENIVAVAGGFAAIVSEDAAPPAVAVLPQQGGAPRRIEEMGRLPLAPEGISRASVLAFANEAGEMVHGLYYPPASATYAAPEGTLPPAILKVHGGPTGMAGRGFDARVQYWTSRGFAVFDIDYTGSTGYGRAFRERLNGAWGVSDVADLLAAARFLGREKLADPARLVLNGSSAGGFTVLMALASAAPGTFAAASIAYGVTDLGQLLVITHKFEAGYLFSLTGTTPDDWEETFRARSPLRLSHRITTPVILFQGLDDKVVPPVQAETMAATLRENGVPVEYVTFPGEGHGFRRAETITSVLAREEAFLRRTLRLAAPT